MGDRTIYYVSNKSEAAVVIATDENEAALLLGGNREKWVFDILGAVVAAQDVSDVVMRTRIGELA